MEWRISRAESRRRYRAKFDAAEAAEYDAFVGRLPPDAEAAYAAELSAHVGLKAGDDVLDAGAGTGTMTAILARTPGLRIVALEPAPAMLDVLRAKPELRDVTAVEGFCDAPEDRALFPAARFDAIVSRQLLNGLFDPLEAFANWFHWLKPGGVVAAIDGYYGRTAWGGKWAEEVDVLPLSAQQSLALAPYLLERAGFAVERAALTEAVNASPATKTTRYLVVARKPVAR